MRSFLLTLLLGCSPADRRPLPDQVVAVVRLERGGYVSLLVELPRPGQYPTIRMSPGVVAAGPRWAHVLHIAELTEGVDRRLELRRIDGISLVSLPIHDDPVLTSIDESGVHVQVGDNYWWMDADRGVVEPSTASAVPGGRQAWPGPRDAFSLQLVDDRLEMLLPRSEGRGTPLIHGVDEVLGSWWLRSDDLPQWEREQLERLFKEVGVLTADVGETVADGHLREWRGSRALAVDALSQVIDGEDYWGGPRDGSFGVAVRNDGSETVLAVRIRDDVLLRDADRLELHLGARLIDIPLLQADEAALGEGCLEGEGWLACFTAPNMTGLGVEIRLDTPLLITSEALPLVVRYVDHDPGQGSTTLGTSAWPQLVELSYSHVSSSKED